jgi:hypothetical protein
LSKGTHDKCACFDVEIVGVPWYPANRWLRRHGWWGWVRTPAQGAWGWHIHTISAGCPAPKGIFVDGAGGTVSSQLDDYRRHALGLKGLHQSNIDPECRTDPGHGFSVFDYPAWVQGRWFEMATKADLAEVIDPRFDALNLRVDKLDALDVELDTVATRDQASKIRQQIRDLRADLLVP